MENEFSLKEIYDVSIKTTQQIEIGSKVFEKGETIAAFDKIQMSNFNEVRKITTANGGFQNSPQVWWENVKDVQVSLSQGIFNTNQLALMTNAGIIDSNDEPIYVPKRETLRSDIDGKITLSKFPYEPRFAYDGETGAKLSNIYNDSQIIITTPNKEIIFDYHEKYENSYRILKLGNQLNNAYFSFTGRTRVKEDVTGKVKTAIINIPQLKLMSDLSMRLGDRATPVLGQLNALACPYGTAGNKQVMEIIFLDDDIDSDI